MSLYAKTHTKKQNILHTAFSIFVVLVLLVSSVFVSPHVGFAGDSPEEDAAKAAAEAAEKAAEEAEEAAEAAREAEEAAREAAEEAAEDAEEAAEDLADELEDERDDDEKAADEAAAKAAAEAAEDEADELEDLEDEEEDENEAAEEAIEDAADAAEDEEDTLEDFGTETNVETGDASSGGGSSNSVNNNTITSEAPPHGSSTPDIDEYSLTATNTNEAYVGNDAEIDANSGGNTASSSSGGSGIITGDAFSGLNLANVVNTNVINSEGLLVLLNEVLDTPKSLDLSGEFDFTPTTYEHSLSTPSCTLQSCLAEEVNYNVQNSNYAEVTNNAVVRAVSGENRAHGGGDEAHISTGDAYAGANVVNVVNTNIIDSNYLLIAVNGLGDLDGNLVLPDAEFFDDFFAQPNGLAYAEETNIDIDNDNTASVGNGVIADAGTGENAATTTEGGASIKTGDATSEVNTINKINQNRVGGDSLYILVNVHGDWSGDVVGLPEGLSWTETSDGIAIYSTGDEVVPSATVPRYDVDEYNLEVNDTNDATIENNVEIYALTGENEITGSGGSISTGDAHAGGNVVNIANTNVVGQNWVLGVFNIFGDFDGDIKFGGTPDLWVGGTALSTDTPVGPGSDIVYTFTVRNNGDTTAHNVMLDVSVDPTIETITTIPDEVLDSGHYKWNLGDIAPGEAVELTVEATIDGELPFGDSTVTATANVMSSDEDADDSDNTETVSLDAFRQGPTGGGGGDNGNGDDNTGGGSDGPSGGGGNNDNNDGGGSSNNDDPDISVTKSSSATTTIESGNTVDYTINIVNDGGYAYDALLEDVVTNEDGIVINRQEWYLGTVLPDEEINVTYTIEFDEMTPTGVYTNTASLTAFDNQGGGGSNDSGGSGGSLPIPDASTSVNVKGNFLEIFNVSLSGPYVIAGDGSALITWDTNLPADGQIFYSLASGGGSPFNAGAFQYGYDNASIYMSSTTLAHGILIDNLIPGASYVYRIVSKTPEGLRDISEEFSLLVPAPAALASAAHQQTTDALGDGEGEETDEATSTEPVPQVAAAFTASPDAFNTFFESPMCIIALLLIILLLALFGWLIEWALGRPGAYDARTPKRSILAVIGSTAITGYIAYLVITMPCLQIPVLIVLTIFAVIMYSRIASRDHTFGGV